MREQILFGAFLARIQMQLPPAEFTEVALDVREQLHADRNIAWNLSTPGVREDYLQRCAVHSRELQRLGPPAHIGGR